MPLILYGGKLLLHLVVPASEWPGPVMTTDPLLYVQLALELQEVLGARHFFLTSVCAINPAPTMNSLTYKSDFELRLAELKEVRKACRISICRAIKAPEIVNCKKVAKGKGAPERN